MSFWFINRMLFSERFTHFQTGTDIVSKDIQVYQKVNQ